MQPRNFVILAAVAGLSLGLAGAALLMQDRPSSSSTLDQPLAPSLSSKINDVARIEVSGPDGTATLERREGRGWVVLEKGGFAADERAIVALLRKLSELRIVEAKTALGDRLPRLELEDPTKAGAKSRSVVLKDAAGQLLDSLVVGKRAFGIFGAGRTGTYVRLANSTQAYLTDSEIELPTGVIEWMSTDIIDLAEDRVKLVSLEPEGGVLVTTSRASSEAAEFDLAGIPAGRVADQTKLSELSRVFSQLSLIDIRPVAEVAFYEAPQRVRVETFDGLTVGLTWISLPDASWIRVESVTANDAAPPEVKEEAARLLVRTNGWAFHVGSYITEQLGQKLDDLLVNPSAS